MNHLETVCSIRNFVSLNLTDKNFKIFLRIFTLKIKFIKKIVQYISYG